MLAESLGEKPIFNNFGLPVGNEDVDWGQVVEKWLTCRHFWGSRPGMGNTPFSSQ